MLQPESSNSSFCFEQWSLENGLSPNITSVLKDQGLNNQDTLLSLTADGIAQLGLNMGQRKKVKTAVRKLRETQEEDLYCYVDMNGALRPDVRHSTDEVYITPDPAKEDMLEYSPQLTALLNRPLPAVPVNEKTSAGVHSFGCGGAASFSARESGHDSLVEQIDTGSSGQSQYYSFPLGTDIRNSPFMLTGDIHPRCDTYTTDTYIPMSGNAMNPSSNDNSVGRRGREDGTDPQAEPLASLLPGADQTPPHWSHPYQAPDQTPNALDNHKITKQIRPVPECLPKEVKKPEKVESTQKRSRTRWSWGNKRNTYV